MRACTGEPPGQLPAGCRYTPAGCSSLCNPVYLPNTNNTVQQSGNANSHAQAVSWLPQLMFYPLKPRIILKIGVFKMFVQTSQFTWRYSNPPGIYGQIYCAGFHWCILVAHGCLVPLHTNRAEPCRRGTLGLATPPKKRARQGELIMDACKGLMLRAGGKGYVLGPW